MSALRKMLLDEAAENSELGRRAKKALAAYDAEDEEAPPKKDDEEEPPKDDDSEDDGDSDAEDDGDTDAEDDGDSDAEDDGDTDAEDDGDARAKSKAKAEDEDDKRAKAAEEDAKKASAKAKAFRAQASVCRDRALALACSNKSKSAAAKLGEAKALDSQAQRLELHARQQRTNAANARSISQLKAQVISQAKAKKTKASGPKPSAALQPLLPNAALGIRGKGQETDPNIVDGLKMIPRHNLEKAGILRAQTVNPLQVLHDGSIGVGLLSTSEAKDLQKQIAETIGKLVS